MSQTPRVTPRGRSPQPVVAGAKTSPRKSPAAKPAAPAKPVKGRAPVDYKANVGKRVGAAFIDVSLAGLLGLVFLVNGWWEISAVLVGVYLLVRDGMGIEPLNRQSIGKRLSNLNVESLADHAPLDIATSCKRNIPLAAGCLLLPVLGHIHLILLPLAAVGPIVELVLLYKDPEGFRFGDKIAQTKVLD